MFEQRVQHYYPYEYNTPNTESLRHAIKILLLPKIHYNQLTYPRLIFPDIISRYTYTYKAHAPQSISVILTISIT